MCNQLCTALPSLQNPAHRTPCRWHKSACLECDQCVAGDTNLCTVALVPTIYGDTQGGFAERFRCSHPSLAML